MKTESNHRPVVGIAPRVFRGQKDGLNIVGTREAYTESIIAAGGVPLILPRNPAELSAYISHVDALLLQGGEDMDPSYYEELPHEKLGTLDKLRDEGDIAALNAALHRDIPILAICRGMQILNVALGGSLYQDLLAQREDTLPNHDCDDGEIRMRWREETHPISITSDSKLAKIFGATTVNTNSLHHQAVKSLGNGLVVTAESPDGVVEAVELPGKKFCIGVQYHPECMWQQGNRIHLKLFEALVNAAKEGSR